MTLVVVFVVGYAAGRVTSWIAGLAALAALAPFLLGLVAPASVTGVVESVLEGVYYGNELPFLSGFLFGVAGGREAVAESRRAVRRRREPRSRRVDRRRPEKRPTRPGSGTGERLSREGDSLR